ncbi:condensation domain-containing protein [Actinosynnema sp. CA-248983]
MPGRPLSAVEEFVARTGTPVVLGATLHGPLDTDALAQAVQHLTDRHPVLTHRITRNGNRHHLTPAPDQPPPHLRHTTPDEPFDTPFTPGDPLLRATLTGEGRLVLAIHHAISDGVSALSLASDLFQTYTALLTGNHHPAPPPEQPLHPATDDLLAHRHPPLKVAAWLAKQAAHLALHPATRLPGHKPSPVPGAHLHTTELTRTQARHLYRTARQHHTTSTALLCAITLQAAHTQLAPRPRPHRLAMGVTIGLRPCTTPPIPAHHLVTATSFVPITTKITPDDTPTTLAPPSTANSPKPAPPPTPNAKQSPSATSSTPPPPSRTP